MLERRAFEPEFLQRLDSLVLGATRARTVRAGRRTLGRIQGAGIEPENFREYTAGDDLRYLDWNAFARLDDLTIRTYRADRQLEMTILLDASASMGLPARDDKLGLALLLAAGLAYVAMSENDPVRLVAFGGPHAHPQLTATRFYHRRESYLEFRPFVAQLAAGGATRMTHAVHELLSERRPAGLFVVISDFLVSAAEYEPALEQLLAARHEVRAFHVMGEQERTGSYAPGAYRLRDCETGQIREVTFGASAAEACRTRAHEHAARVSSFCTRRGVMLGQAFDAARADEIIAREFPRLGVIA